MKNKKLISGLIDLIYISFYGFIAYFLTLTKLTDVVIITIFIGILQVKNSSDMIQIQNDIFDLKKQIEEEAKNKYPNHPTI